MLLKELHGEKAAGTYVAAVPSSATVALLHAWAHENKFEIVDDLHVTLLYSRKVVNVVPCKDEFVATGDRLEVLGGCLVLKLVSQAIERRHAELIAQGGTHDFPEFIPHITLQKDTKVKPDGIPMPMFGLIFQNEYNEPLKP